VRCDYGHFDINDKGIDTRDVKNILSRVDRDLKTINLPNNRIGSLGVEYLVERNKNDTVDTVDLSGNNIEARGAISIARMLKKSKTLKTLSLESTKIGPKGAEAIAEALKENTSLKSLDLSENHIGSEWIKMLRNNQTLVSLRLSHTNIGNTGAKLLAGWLKTNKSLHVLDLHSTRLSDIDPLIDWMKVNETVTTLNLSGNADVENDKYKEFLMSIGENNPLTDLDLSYNRLKTFCDLPKVKHHLSRLTLVHNNLTDDDIAPLSEWIGNSLTMNYLNLTTNKIGDKGAQILIRNNQSLTRLDLLNNSIQDAPSLKRALEENANLEYLYIGCNVFEMWDATELEDYVRNRKRKREDS